MLHVSKISKSYGSETVLSGISFLINRGERAALIGPNGCGKTTLMRIITGQEGPDAGQVRFDPPGLSPGYLPQALEFEASETVAGALARASAGHSQAWADMQRYAAWMADPPPGQTLAALAEAYAEAEMRFEAAGGYALEARLEAVLAGLGLAEVDRGLPVEHLSGGQKTRLGLAGLLIQALPLLLLDEPTNHLDIDGLAWLETWLQDYDGAVLLTSHDRTFLDGVSTRCLVMDPSSHGLRDFSGTYSAFVQVQARERERQWQAYRDQQDEIARLRRAAQRLRGQAKMRRGGKSDSGDKFAKGFFSDQSAGSMARARQIERRLERLLTEDRLEKPVRHWQLRSAFAGDDSGARQVLRLENVAMAFNQQPLFSGVNLTLTHGQRMALVGPNGAGKTTLLRIIAGELAPSAGHVRLGAGVKVGYMAQEQEILDPEATPYETIRGVAPGLNQTQARTFLHRFLFAGDDVFVKIRHLSFGQRSRLMLAHLVAQGCNLLLLDEPVNHLDIPSRESFEEALIQFPGSLLVVVHDRAFIRRVATGMWDMRGGRVMEHIL
jgi:ATPase subunit of ABC transporter with duplicated ATPase domains